METLITIGIGIFSWLFAVFAFSNILLPIFFSRVQLRKEEALGNLIKKVPAYMVYYSPISWTIIFSGLIIYQRSSWPEFNLSVLVGVCLAFVQILSRLIKRNPDMYDDFQRTYKDYLKTPENNDAH